MTDLQVCMEVMFGKLQCQDAWVLVKVEMHKYLIQYLWSCREFSTWWNSWQISLKINKNLICSPKARNKWLNISGYRSSISHGKESLYRCFDGDIWTTEGRMHIFLSWDSSLISGTYIFVSVCVSEDSCSQILCSILGHRIVKLLLMP